MKKRIEKVVERTVSCNNLTVGKKYPVQEESKWFYLIIDDNGNINSWDKDNFKVVEVREVLEFEGRNLDVFGRNQYSLEVISEIDLWNYDLKVIATPKDAKSADYLWNNLTEYQKQELLSKL